jgi:chorismate mutase
MRLKGYPESSTLVRMGDATTALADLRNEIDAIDAKILALLTERAERVLRVGEIKRTSGIPVHDPERERIILGRLASLARAPIGAETVKRVFERIIEESRRLENQHLKDNT